MTEQWAVSHIDWHDYELKIILVNAASFREAIIIGVLVGILKRQVLADCDDLPDTEEAIKQYFLDMDSMVDAVKVPPTT